MDVPPQAEPQAPIDPAGSTPESNEDVEVAAVAAEAAEAEAVGGLPGLLLSPSLAGLYVIVEQASPEDALLEEASLEEEGSQIEPAPPPAALTVIDVDDPAIGRRRAPPSRFIPERAPALGRSKRKQPAPPPNLGPPIHLKHEDVAKGLIRCPSCTSALHVGDGCALQVCRRYDHPGGGWFYFCFHCRESLGEGGRHCNKCPYDNDPETRQLVKKRNNVKARRNPIELD